MSDHSSSTGTVLAAFVLGALAGAVAGLLFAPASGAETRRRIADKAREGRDRAADMAREGREFLHRGRETLAGAVERGREAFEQARKEPL